ncbi:hypothetical protein V496_01014 [Pseudogymnoascus sp. VKM F-4515 (FW-2607)]|nr:hypothetical protein V496_01014 [Pseudogymnoascus sp. VKM F-4515 (FW-2607)]
MAYNRSFNPDALPAFAEPERKRTPTAPAASPPPLNIQKQHPSARHSPSHHYDKPAPPLPRDDRDYRPSGGSGSSSRPIPSPRDDRHHPSSSGAPPGSVSQPGGNFTYGQSPPQDRRLDGARDGRDGRDRDGRDTRGYRGPASPALTGEDPNLLPLFRAVDKDGSGHLSESELSAALVNGDWTAFDPHTVALMIRMFDTSRSGTIEFSEFCGLWSFLASWRTLFDRFDADRSGNISLDEFSSALVAFGYRLSDSFVGFLFRAFDKGRKGNLSFDLFVQACITLKRMTDAFKRYDDDRDGFVTLSFEQFLEEVLRQR